MNSTAPSTHAGRWLVLIHHLPPTPNYLRVKVGRRLVRIGAVALKNTVYVLPRSDRAQEDFQWVLRDVRAAGGDAMLFDASVIDGLSDCEIESLFCNARDADYKIIADGARAVEQRLDACLLDDELRGQIESSLTQFERRLDEISTIDFFDAPARKTTYSLLANLRSRITVALEVPKAPQVCSRDEFRRRTWVTRAGIHVDRIASAWLILRCIDPDASFKFVAAKGYVPEPREVRFDMFEAEFSHEEDMCTFEVLCSRFEANALGLRAIAELVHDIDLKDGKFARPETPGLAAQIAGLALMHRDDNLRLSRGIELFDELLAYFSKTKS